MSSNSLDGLTTENIGSLSDAELRAKFLQTFGTNMGPITATTRLLYERKLLKHFDSKLAAPAPANSANGAANTLPANVKSSSATNQSDFPSNSVKSITNTAVNPALQSVKFTEPQLSPRPRNSMNSNSNVSGNSKSNTEAALRLANRLPTPYAPPIKTAATTGFVAPPSTLSLSERDKKHESGRVSQHRPISRRSFVLEVMNDTTTTTPTCNDTSSKLTENDSQSVLRPLDYSDRLITNQNNRRGTSQSPSRRRRGRRSASPSPIRRQQNRRIRNSYDDNDKSWLSETEKESANQIKSHRKCGGAVIALGIALSLAVALFVYSRPGSVSLGSTLSSYWPFIAINQQQQQQIQQQQQQPIAVRQRNAALQQLLCGSNFARGGDSFCITSQSEVDAKIRPMMARIHAALSNHALQQMCDSQTGDDDGSDAADGGDDVIGQSGAVTLATLSIAKLRGQLGVPDNDVTWDRVMRALHRLPSHLFQLQLIGQQQHHHLVASQPAELAHSIALIDPPSSPSSASGGAVSLRQQLRNHLSVRCRLVLAWRRMLGRLVWLARLLALIGCTAALLLIGWWWRQRRTRILAQRDHLMTLALHHVADLLRNQAQLQPPHLTLPQLRALLKQRMCRPTAGIALSSSALQQPATASIINAADLPDWLWSGLLRNVRSGQIDVEVGEVRGAGEVWKCATWHANTHTQSQSHTQSQFAHTPPHPQTALHHHHAQQTPSATSSPFGAPSHYYATGSQQQQLQAQAGAAMTSPLPPTNCLKVRRMLPALPPGWSSSSPQLDAQLEYARRHLLERLGPELRPLHVGFDRVPPASPGNNLNNSSGSLGGAAGAGGGIEWTVYVKFRSNEEAGRAFQLLNAHYFEERLLQVRFIRQHKYDSRFSAAA